MTNLAEVIVTANFEDNLESIRCYFHQHQQASSFDILLDKVFDTIIPNLQTHPMIGLDFLAQTVSSLEESRQVDIIRQRLPQGTSVRQYNDKDFIVLYALQGNQVFLLSIKHQQQMLFDLRQG